MSLRRARWIEVKQDPASYYENYDYGPPIPQRSADAVRRVPAADYVAAHILAIAEDDPSTTNNFTFRVGRYEGGHGQVLQHDFAGSVPRRGEQSQIEGRGTLATPSGSLVHVRIPWSTAFAQVMERFIDLN